MTDPVTELARILSERSLTISFAESCTGGLLSSRIVSLPGSSSFFLGSAVTYSNEAKMKILGVKEETLIAHGAVSRETATEMADGCRKAFPSDISGSITGIAGPGGGSEEKPVGTVYMCITDGIRHKNLHFIFSGDRDSIRSQSADAMIRNVIEFLE